MSERVLGWWYCPAPPQRLALLRILIGSFGLVYLLVRSPSLLSVLEFSPEHFEPVGVVALLSAPLPAWATVGSVLLAVVAGAAFVAGFAFRVSGPSFALLLLWVTSYRSSWGMLFHTENLLTLHVLLLGASPAAAALSWDARRAARLGLAPDPGVEHGRFGWAIRSMAVVTTVTYLVAGVAKLKLSGGAWLGGELLRAQIAYDNLRKLELGGSASPLGPWLVRHAALFPPLAVTTLLIELGAPLALLRRRLALFWAFGAWGFHFSVLLLMGIGFFYPLTFVAFAPLFRVELGWQRALQRLRRGAPASRAAA